MTEKIQTGIAAAPNGGADVLNANAPLAGDFRLTAAAAAEQAALIVRGARVHNLKNISFEIPHNAITVVSGVSGSGKSSLAFDTIYAEGQRRYIESLSAYARQFLERIEKPDVDEINGIAPAIAIKQKNSTRNPRSTVATATEIYDYLRLLYARAGRTYCTRCGAEVRRDTIDEITARVMQLETGRRFYVLFRVPLGGAALTDAAGAKKTKADFAAELAAAGSSSSAATATESAARMAATNDATANDAAANAEIAAIVAGSQLAALRRVQKAAKAARDVLKRKNAKPTVPAGPTQETIREGLLALQKRGFNRLYQDGRVHEFSSPETLLDVDFTRPVYAVVDRLAIGPDIRARLADSVEICYREGGGEAILEFPAATSSAPLAAATSAAPNSNANASGPRPLNGEIAAGRPELQNAPDVQRAPATGSAVARVFPAPSGDGGPEAFLAQQNDPAAQPQPGPAVQITSYGFERITFSERFECKTCGLTYQEPEPRLFSFNNPYGACPRCQGFGNTIDFGIDLVIPDRGRSINDGVIEPWTKPRYRTLWQELKTFARGKNIPLDAPFRDLTEAQQEMIVEGDPKSRFPGVKGFFTWLERKKYKLHVRVFLSRYRGYATCPECSGTRLRPEARAVRVSGKSITQACMMTVAQAREFFGTLELGKEQAAIADKILEEVQQRLRFLDEVGLDYITLDRLASTLSGGEAQRIQLATSLGSQLVGALYVLDEPSIGLHPRDTHRLIEILKSLRDLGNTILLVEHDPDCIAASDYVLDLGPGAGELGGKLLYAGPRSELLLSHTSLTARYLTGELRIPVPQLRHKPNKRFLRVFGARAHNLQNVDVMIPLGTMVAVTGVSGSGKSTLVHDVIYKGLELKRTGANLSQLCDKIEGDQFITELVLVDQSPIGRTPRSNPSTYLKAFDAIRDVFAGTPEAKRRGYGAGHFSFNIPGGRCEACQGDGTVTVEMQFLADVELVCEECRGTRFKSSVLEIRWRDKNVHDVLGMTVREALAFFAGVPRVTTKLKVLEEVGLGYLRLGQSATTLSGGEAQRLKLASHLIHQASPGMLYIFDEPTTGLHFDDIQKLLGAFRKLIERGASILVIEHNLDVIKCADWVIDLGPEGGSGGGRIVGTGTPEQIARNAKSYTGKYLAPVLKAHG